MEQTQGIQAMSDKQNDGGPAFPCESYGHRNGKETTIPTNGMSLRDWFAAQASEEDINAALTGGLQAHVPRSQISRAWAKYAYADWMLAARERGAK